MNIDIALDSDFSNTLINLKDSFGEDLAKINGFSNSSLNHTDFIDSFVDRPTVADSSVDPSSNVGRHDMPTLLGELPKSHKKLLSYNKIYYEIKKKHGKEIADAWLISDYDGHLYMHDAPTASFASYCYAYDLKDLAERGLYFLDDGTFNAQPPQHLETFIDFVKEFVSFSCNRTSGAVGLPNLLPYMYYFWHKDCNEGYIIHDEIYYAKQQFQRLIYALNQPYTRDGVQSAFTNTSIFDHNYFEALFGGAVFPDGSFMIDYEEEIIEFQKLFLETMSDIRSQNMMTFPVNTISLLYQNNTFVDEEFARWAIEHNRKWSDSNLFVDSTVNSLSNCCRLKSSIEEIGLLDSDKKLEDFILSEMHKEYLQKASIDEAKLSLSSFKQKISEDVELKKQFDIRKKEKVREAKVDEHEALGHFNSIGGSSLSVGSVKVSTINLARIALESKTEEEYLEKLKYYVNLDCIALDAVRHIISRNVDKGLLQNFTYGLLDFDHLYNTIGFIGVYETLKKFNYVATDFAGDAKYTPEGETFGKAIFDTIHNESKKFLESNQLDYKINCEQTPGESAADKLMKKDKYFYPEDVVDDLPLYGNQFMPLGIKTSLSERVRTQALFDSFCNGGSILHANIDAPIDSFDKAWKLVNYIASSGVTYFAFNPRIQACKHNHGFYGTKCPTCGEPVAAEFTRIVGFFTQVNNWAEPRKEEYKLRQWADVNK